MKRLREFMSRGLHGNAPAVDAGLFVLRLFTGLALMTVFEKLLPRDGVWGPQPWFIDDVSAMGWCSPSSSVVFCSLSAYGRVAPLWRWSSSQQRPPSYTTALTSQAAV